MLPVDDVLLTDCCTMPNFLKFAKLAAITYSKAKPLYDDYRSRAKQDNIFSKIQKKLKQVKLVSKLSIRVCNVFYQRGKGKGQSIGKREGIDHERKNIALRLLKYNIDAVTIHKATKLKLDEINKLTK